MADIGDLESRGQLIRKLVDDFRRRQQAGAAVSAQSLIAAYPELMPELAATVNAPRLIAEARAQAEAAEAGCADTEEADPAVDTVASGGLQIRCPHCHTSVEIAPDTPFANITCTACGSHFSLTGDELETPVIGPLTTVGHFELVERLGQGGFGTVWKARDTELDRTVAVKIPRRGHLEADELEQFLREARTVAQLKHPNIVGIHEVGRDGNTVYIVTDLVHGVPLSDCLTERRLTVREAAELCRKIAEALHHAHERGVIHRDLKPQNIMIDAEGEPHLMDFGLARREAGEITMTMDGQVLGTPAYMSPEQAQGQAHRAGRGSDLYSLGAILFELLTGELPFRGNARMLIHQVVHQEAPSPRMLNGHVPRDLETICLKCLEKDARKRYGSARELAEELRRFLQGKSIQARPIGVLARAWRRCRRYPIVSGLAAGLLVAILGGLAGVTTQWMRAEKNAVGQMQARKRAEQQREIAEQNLYLAHMRVAQQDWEVGHVHRMRKLLEAHRPASGAPDLRGWEWYYLMSLCDKDVVTLRGHGGAVNSLAWSPDGRRLAAVDESHLIVWDADTNRQILEVPGHTSVAWSPDGQRLASLGPNNTIRVWQAETGHEVVSFAGQAPMEAVTWSPDGQWLAAGGKERTVQIWNVATGRVCHTLRGHEDVDIIWSLAWSPDGRRLAAGGNYQGKIQIWDADTGRELNTLDAHGHVVSSLAWSPNGERLVSASWDQTVKAWDAASWQTVYETRAHPGRVLSISWSGDGTRLATVGDDSTVRVWDANTGNALRVIRGHEASTQAVAWSPNGSRLASASSDGTVKVWDPTVDQESITLNGFSPATWSPDGRQLAAQAQAVGTKDTTIKVWTTATGQEVLDFRSGGTGLGAGSLAWSPDGRHLAWAIAGGSAKGMLKVLDVGTRQEVLNVQAHTASPRSVAWSPDSCLLATAGMDREVKIWDAATGEDVLTFGGHSESVGSAVWSPDGKRLASASWDQVVVIWDASTTREIFRLRHRRGWGTNGQHSVAWHATGDRLAVGTSSGAVIIWDAETGREMLALEGHTSNVKCVAWSPDGTRLASGSEDGTVKVWDTSTGHELLTLRGHLGVVSTVAWSPDGRRLMSAGDHVRIWDAPLGN